MPLMQIQRHATAFALSLGLLGLAACDDDGTAPGDPAQIIAKWNVTAFVTGDDDLIADGMHLVVTMGANGMYTFDVTNDLADVCGGAVGDNCTRTGSYAFTATEVTINDEEPQDATTFTYDVDGASMTWTGNIGGTAVVITFIEVS